MLRIDYRVIVIRILRYAGKRRRFDKGKILDFLAEIGICGSPDPVTALRQVYTVQVHLKYLCFVVLFFKIKCLQDLLRLALNGHVIVFGDILYNLLGYR